MSTRRSLVISFLIFIALTIYGFMVVRGMPDIVPTHWNSAGQVDGYGSKWITALLMPGILLFNLLLIVVLPKMSPKMFEIATFLGTFNYVMLIVTCMEAALGIVILHTTANQSFPIVGAMFGVMFLFFGFLGNVLGKVRRNFFMGIKTPWTLADERVWDQTHRQAARIWTIGGFVGFIVSFFLPFWVLITGMMAMCFYPVVSSYFIYKRLDRGGQIAGPGV